MGYTNNSRLYYVHNVVLSKFQMLVRLRGFCICYCCRSRYRKILDQVSEKDAARHTVILMTSFCLWILMG